MPSWEDIVNQVVIPGEPVKLMSARRDWAMVFGRIRSAKKEIEDGLRRLDEWRGDAADAYRTNVAAIAHELDRLNEEYQGVQWQLDAAAHSLADAINTIEIPAEMAYFVEQAKADFFDRGHIAGLGPDAIYNFMSPVYRSKLGALWFATVPDALIKFETGVRDSLSDDAAHAQQAFAALDGRYANVHAELPNPSNTVTGPHLNDFHNVDLSNVGPGPSGGAPSTFGDGNVSPMATVPADPFNADPFNAGEDSYASGLASVGGPGLGGLSPAGVDPATGLIRSGSGPGGIDPGGTAAGLPPGTVRRAGLGGMPMAGIPMGGAPAGGAANRSGRGAGMIGGPTAGASGNEVDPRDSWLTEDDDVWGNDLPVAPPVLGKRPTPTNDW